MTESRRRDPFHARPLAAQSCLFVAAAAALLSGCGGGIDCTDDIQASVWVHVVDANGAAVTDAIVTYSRNGGAFAPAECRDLAPNGSGCTTWVAGWESEGEFVVRAESADGAQQDEKAVVVFADACHVEGKTVTLTLG